MKIVYFFHFQPRFTEPPMAVRAVDYINANNLFDFHEGKCSITAKLADRDKNRGCVRVYRQLADVLNTSTLLASTNR